MSALPRAVCSLSFVLAACGGPEGPVEPVEDDGAEPVVADPADTDAAHPDDPPGWEPIVEFQGTPVETVREHHEAGGVARIATRKRDVNPPVDHGPEWTLFKNGVVKDVRMWADGVWQGPFSSRYPSGVLKVEGEYRDGQRHGAYRTYFKGAELQKEYHYEAGVPDGWFREWFAGGQPRFEGLWEAGKQVGAHRTWGKGGWLVLEETFVDGVRHGEWADYQPETGDPRSNGRFEEGERAGPWVFRDVDGSRREEEYAAGRLHGARRLYSSEGALLAEEGWVEGRQEGPTTLWYPDGSKRAEGAYVAGQREGEWTYWRRDGSVHEAWTGTYHGDTRVPD